MIFESFRSFYEKVVIPLRSTNPDDKRLDGWPSGGNFAVAGRFIHRGRRWKVHADSHYEPLELAYQALAGPDPREPFTVAATKNGDRLDLIPELQRERGTRHRHLYAYSDD